MSIDKEDDKILSYDTTVQIQVNRDERPFIEEIYSFQNFIEEFCNSLGCEIYFWSADDDIINKESNEFKSKRKYLFPEANIDMTQYLNQANVLIKFVATSAYGNNLYIDEVNLHAGAPTNRYIEISSVNTFEVYPNPFQNQTTLNINTTKAERISFEVVDLLGNKVMSQDLGVVNGLYRQSIDASSWNAGIYFINITSSEGGSITKKINVIK
jgi:hypothetical protein